MQGGTLSRALLLPTSLYPCRDKSIEEDKGRSANRAGISFGFLFSFVGFYTRISRIKQNGNCQIWRDRKSPTNTNAPNIVNLKLAYSICRFSYENPHFYWTFSTAVSVSRRTFVRLSPPRTALLIQICLVPDCEIWRDRKSPNIAILSFISYRNLLLGRKGRRSSLQRRQARRHRQR